MIPGARPLLALALLGASLAATLSADRAAAEAWVQSLARAIPDRTAGGSLLAGAALFALCHALAVAACFPLTVLFEFAAGSLFGPVVGLGLVLAAKTVGGGVGFLLGRTLLREYVRSWLESTGSTQAETAGDAGNEKEEKSKTKELFAKLVRGAERDAWRVVFLVRLSPLPSWLGTYGLAAMTSVPVLPFAVATAVGSLPFVAQNVYLGSLATGVAGLGSGGQDGWVKTAMGAVGVVASMLTARLFIKYANESEEREDGNARSREPDRAPRQRSHSPRNKSASRSQRSLPSGHTAPDIKRRK